MIKKLRYCFLLVLLLHLLFFLGFTIVIVDADDNNKPPEQDEESKAQRVLPSYVYQEQPPPAPVQNTVEEKPSLLKPVTPNTAKNGILKPKAATPKPPAQAATDTTRIGTKGKETGAPQPDPANLVADKPTDKPLIKLLSRATGAQLFYPKSAQDFHITGIVRIQFYITPEGYVSQVVLLQSSGSSQLDEAGIYAISHISPVKGVDAYLKKARTLTVGIIFG